MKKILSWILALVMLFNAVPLLAVADVQYDVHFDILPASQVYEEAYRQWAAQLLDVYRNQYAFVNGDNVFQQNPQEHLLRLNGSKWEMYQAPYDKALYHPYYILAQRKGAFNISTDANKESFGRLIHTTEYTLLTEDERKVLYLWILKETIQDKASINPHFFTQEVEGNERLYSFSVKDGVLVPDSQLKSLEEATVADAWADVGTLAVSALEVAMEAAYAWDKLGQQSAELIAEAAKEEAKGSKDYMGTFVKTMKDKAVAEAIDFITNSLQDVVDTVNDNFQKSIRNVMKAQMTSELLNSMIDCNVNIVNYLRTTYIDDPTYLLDQEFASVVEAVVNVMDSEEFQQVMQTKAEGIVTDDFMQKLEQQAGISYDTVLSTEELCQTISQAFILNLVESISNILTSVVKEGGKLLVEKIKGKDNDNAGKAFAAEMTECLAEVVEELVKRLGDMAEDLLKGWQDGSLTVDNLSTQASEIADKHFLEGKNTAFMAFVLDSLVDHIVTGIAAAFGTWANPDEEKTPEQKLQDKAEQQERLDSISKRLNSVSSDSLQNTAVNLGLDQNNAAGKAMWNGILSLARALMAAVKDSVDAHKEKLTAQQLDSFNQLIASLDQIVKDCQGFITAGKVTNSKMADALVNMADVAVNLIEWICTLDMETSSAILQSISLQELGENSIGEIIKNAIKDTNWRDMLFTAIFGGTVKGTQKEMAENSAKLTPVFNKNGMARVKSSIKANCDKLSQTMNSTVEGVVTIVGDLWDTMMDCAADLATVSNSVCSNLTGTPAASLQAERARQLYLQSVKLESVILHNTITSRLEAYRAWGQQDYEHFLSTYEYNGEIRYRMTSEDICFFDDAMQCWPLTPNLAHVKVLTDYILTQMNLDAVGMGVYATLLKERTPSGYGGSVLYKKYFNEGVFCEEAEAMRRYNEIVKLINNTEATRPVIP